MADTSDVIEYQILMEASKAIQDLNALTQNAATTDEKIKMVAQSVMDFGQKMGISASTAAEQFKVVERAAADLQIRLDALRETNAPMPLLGPLQQQLATIQPVFPGPVSPGVGSVNVSPAMWKEVNVQVKETQAGLEKINLDAERVAKSMEQSAVAASGLNVQTKTVAQNMTALQSFTEGAKGQGILKNFLLGYQGTDDIQAKLRTLKTAIFDLAQGSGASFEQAGNLLRTSFNIPNVQVTTAIKELNNELGNTPPQAQKAVRSLDAIRIALGAIVAMLVFQVVQAFQNFFAGAIKNANDMQGALYNLANAERILSQQGIEIAPKDLREQIDDLQRLVPILSQIDATKAVSSIALFTKDLGYTKDQIKALTDAVGTLYVRNQAMGLSFEQVLSQVQTGLLTGRAQGIRDLGVSISEAAIKQEALRMGLVKSEEEFNKLTGDMETQIKAQAMLNIIVRNTADEQKNLAAFTETAAGKQKQAAAAWETFKTRAGTAFEPVLKGLAEFGIFIINAIEGMAKFSAAFNAHLIAPFMVWSVLVKGNIRSFDDLKTAYQTALSALESGMNRASDPLANMSSMTDTATGSVDKLTSSLVDMSQVDLSSLGNSLQSIQDRMDDLTRDFNLKNQNYLEEQNVKMTRMQEDYQIEVQKVIQDANNKQKEANQKYRTQEEDAEAKYQERMRELREKYLLDLEDALRARDARQVLRLQAQYKMEKENLTRNYELDKKNRADQHAQEIAKIKSDEQQKLDEMAKAEALKESRAIEDFNREQALRQQEYDNQMSDLRRSWDERLTEEANKIAEEYGIDEKGAEAIKKLLQKYYGTGGVFDGLYSGSLNSLKIKGSAILAEMASIIAQFQSMTGASTLVGTFPNNEEYRGGGGTYNGSTPVTGGGSSSSFSGSENATGNKRRAKGGIDFANRPTSVVFGEAGPELNISLPLGKSLGDVPNNLPASLQPQGINGLIRLALDLNPDLEVRIMENTLDKAAVMVTHTYRSRK